jgi:RNA polymerase sigma-70 factor (ECF subfamily)
MDDAAREFDELMRRVRDGCPQAAEELFNRYSDAVRRVVRRWLEERLRRQYDSADFVQSVWGSFFHVDLDTFNFHTPSELVAFLSRMAYNKVIDATRKRLGTRRRGNGQEQSLDAPSDPDAHQPLGQMVPAPTHTPSQYAMADERWQQLIGSLPPGHRRILELLREGHDHVEIADRLGVDRKAVQRVVNRLRELARLS